MPGVTATMAPGMVMERLTQVERITAILVSLVSLGFVAGGILILNIGDHADAWKGWMMIVFFGVCALVGVFEMIDEPFANRQMNAEDTEGIVAKYRSTFKRRLGGHWCSYLEGGEDMIHGMTMDFHDDGTGKTIVWENTVGVGGTGEPQIEETFRWECIGDRCVRLTSEGGDESVVSYDFKVWNGEYDIPMVQLLEPGHWASEQFGEEGFWVSPYSMRQYPE